MTHTMREKWFLKETLPPAVQDRSGAPSTSPAWVVRGARVVIDDRVAVITHLGDPWTGARENGHVYLRPERGGHEFTADIRTIEPAPGHPVDERLLRAGSQAC
ncbi:hypothetical protein J1792_18945 [Streptomyces triculaminicus]|uniref:Uncharacterized protein n=1 Tax=Streptomyces triculaminicus TaxID=2816232 RepID=A0A939FRP1_9ACTN|nr:hypothetical protein [Streptomyces triculaminicus]MBO0654775.1 hypothetical protein [Streptomyces triculaminicus]